ncbi:hypothetical protein LSAT2_010745 [Lamellibrachia satsuma]|nr:hypothetical protein LSAT2_010745 [Lamellibrachia satsuma]
MTLIGCWRFTGTSTQNGVVTVDNSETTPLLPDSFLGGFTKPSESRINEIISVPIFMDNEHRVRANVCHNELYRICTADREETSTAQRTSIVPSTSSIQTTTMTKATTTAHTTLLCYACGSYKNDMRQNCESANFGTTVCNECWVYRQDWDGTMVTYARGCQSAESNVASDNCDDFSSESCSTVGRHTLCRQCCKSDRCNNGKLTGNSAYVTAISYFVVTSTAALSLIVTTLV